MSNAVIRRSSCALWRRPRAVRLFSARAEAPRDYFGRAKQYLKEILLGGGFITLAAFGISHCTVFKDLNKDLLMPNAIDNSKVMLSKEEMGAFVHRPALEKRLADMFTTPPYGGYNIIYGAKGVGKSFAVQHVAADHEGVVMLHVGNIDAPEDVMSQLTKELTGKEEKGWDLNKLITAIKRCERPPTIIFDVDRGKSSEQVRGLEHVRTVCKNLAEYSRCFVLLSEANALVEFGRDRAREKFLFVGEMTIDEAKTLLELRLRPDRSLSEETMDYFFETIGTNAAILKSLSTDVNNGLSVDEFVESTLQKSKNALEEFPFKKILKALKEHPEGVSINDFEGVFEEGTNLRKTREVMRGAKEYNVILYHERLNQYQLVSTDLKTAIKTLVIPDQTPSWFYFWKK